MTAEEKEGSPAKRTELSRHRVITAALALLDREGLGALSMRRLADELNVGTMSLYHYVSDKEDLINGVIEVVLGEPYRRRRDEPWTDVARAVASAFRASALAHPAAIKLLFSTLRTSESATARWDELVKVLVADGKSSEQIRRVLRTLSRFMLGWCVAEIGEIGDRSITRRRHEGDGDFVFALDVILEGLQNRVK